LKTLRILRAGAARISRPRVVAGVVVAGLLGAFAVAVAAAPDGGMAPLPIDVAAPNPPLDKPLAATIRIVMTVVPNTKKAMVFWGKKRLGIIAQHAPLIVQRPRDSGPLDLVFKSDGYLTVQTRAYTFGDNKLAVKLTPLDQKNTLLGYREELPPPDAGAPPGEPDGGMP
jgi:hypothetical protein